jgi:hypothetical protein
MNTRARISFCRSVSLFAIISLLLILRFVFSTPNLTKPEEALKFLIPD